MNRHKRNALIIILVTNAILISLLEFFVFIPLPIPGIKLGLANIITLMAIFFLDFRYVINVVVIRCLVVAVLTRGVLTLAFSLTGGILSAIVMAVLYKKFSAHFSIKGISIAGAIVHNTAQITVAAFLIGQVVIFYYLPILLVSAVVTGWITGSIGERVIYEIKHKQVLAS
ncbi:Gx transporter family protein [Salisediminibacterium halotolerans]|uniref:Heptaprenyl diphosphate synthase n=1 Tax=Salisediminibacterium halotolerans TaxID=517425 RepID=A0A1H9TAJ7_9BACI|nr:Gx transporter family protein [Salisediminibacterium haloalkalitolerans]SER93974.1 heptaprenyl diphosphate synthase [Salisediminibacterium haloalkalitolerans]